MAETKETKVFYVGVGVKRYRPVIFGFLIAVVLFIGAIFLANTPFIKNLEQNIRKDLEEAQSNKMPEKNYFGANAKVLSVDTVASTIKVESTHPSGLKKTWNLFISKDTILTTFKSWSQASSGPYGRVETEKLEKLSLTSFKPGDSVYVDSLDDLANNTEIKNVADLLIQ